MAIRDLTGAGFRVSMNFAPTKLSDASSDQRPLMTMRWIFCTSTGV